MFFKRREEKKPGAGSVQPTTIVPPVPVAEPVRLLKNGDFSEWSNGDRFEDVKPYQELADGWRLAFDGKTTGQVDVSRSPGGMVVSVVEPMSSWLGLEQVFEDAAALPGKAVTLSIAAQSDRPLSVTATFIVVTSAGQLRSAPWVVPIGPDGIRTEQQVRIPSPAPGAVLQSASLFIEIPNALTYALLVSAVEAVSA